jgi:para-nitrobenzyl esterase
MVNQTLFGRRSRTRFCVVALSLFMMTSAGAAKAQATSNLVSTNYGPVQGTINDGVQSFLGIPFAAPPVGPLRWRPPQPPAAWSQPLKAVTYASGCPQNDRQVVFASPSMNENCLYLNVFTLRPGMAPKRPVMVWIFGGNLLDGEVNDYDPSKLVRLGNVVVVTLNYRLGILGYLAQSSLDGEGHDIENYGLMDQQFALAWVKKNIAMFGGDPGNVTLFGQSAGARSVYANLMSPRDQGLFQRAISESGAMFPLATQKFALKNGSDFAKAAGCSDQSASCLRALPVLTILKYQKPYLTGLILDGRILPQQPAAALRSGNFNHVPMINGTNRDEATFFTAVRESVLQHPMTSGEYPKALVNILASKVFDDVDPLKVVAAYPLTAYQSPSLAYAAAVTDLYACLARQQNRWLSQYVPVYAYQFEDRNAPSYFPTVSFPLQAYHTAELQFLFPGFHAATGKPQPLTQDQERLSDQMVSAWTGLAAFGKLNPPWQLYKVKLDNYLSLNVGKSSVISGQTFSAEHNCSFWSANLVQ